MTLTRQQRRKAERDARKPVMPLSPATEADRQFSDLVKRMEAEQAERRRQREDTSDPWAALTPEELHEDWRCAPDLGGQFGWRGPNHPDKGERDGRCNRTACQRPLAGFVQWSMERHGYTLARNYYCDPCARRFNEADIDMHRRGMTAEPLTFRCSVHLDTVPERHRDRYARHPTAQHAPPHEPTIEGQNP